MKISHLMPVAGLILAWLASSAGNAKEPDPTVDYVLAKWEEASQKCKTLDAKLTVFHYDAVFGDGQPTITHGRFYYEAPNLGRYEIRKRETAKKATNDWSDISLAIIWTGKETLCIDGQKRGCCKWPEASISRILGQPERNNEGWFSAMFSNIAYLIARIIQGPQQALPLLVGIRAIEIRERFDVTIEKSGEDIQLKAVPKHQADKASFREIDVIVSAKTYMTVARQEFSPNGRDRTVHQLSDEKVNQRPSDRDQLLAPDLSGLHVTEDTVPIVDSGSVTPAAAAR